MTRILHNELHCQCNVTSTSRLGAGGTRGPAPILVSLASESEVRDVLKAAKRLRDSADPAVKASVFINPDLTKLERREQYELRNELKRRKAAGEANLIIRGGAVVVRSRQPQATQPDT